MPSTQVLWLKYGWVLQQAWQTKIWLNFWKCNAHCIAPVSRSYSGQLSMNSRKRKAAPDAQGIDDSVLEPAQSPVLHWTVSAIDFVRCFLLHVLPIASRRGYNSFVHLESPKLEPDRVEIKARGQSPAEASRTEFQWFIWCLIAEVIANANRIGGNWICSFLVFISAGSSAFAASESGASDCFLCIDHLFARLWIIRRQVVQQWSQSAKWESHANRRWDIRRRYGRLRLVSTLKPDLKSLWLSQRELRDQKFCQSTPNSKRRSQMWQGRNERCVLGNPQHLCMS